MGDSSDSDSEFDKDDPYCFDPDWEDCYALASDVQGGPDEESSSDEEVKAGGSNSDAEPVVCVCQNCRYVKTSVADQHVYPGSRVADPDFYPSWIRRKFYITLEIVSSVADPHHLDADSEPQHCFKAQKLLKSKPNCSSPDPEHWLWHTRYLR